MRTAGEIAQRALVRSGIVAAGETPEAAEISDAVTTLSDMLDSWSLERLLVYGSVELMAPVAGLSRLTIGPSGDLLAERPNSVLTGFVRTLACDKPLQMASPEFMDGIRRKDIKCDAYWMSYEGAMPDGVLQLWPTPDDGVLHLRVTQTVAQITDINDELDLPPGWWKALTENLAVDLCEEYGVAVTPALDASARAAKSAIKRINIQPAVATFDRALL